MPPWAMIITTARATGTVDWKIGIAFYFCFDESLKLDR
jgi:hypothetical protein